MLGLARVCLDPRNVYWVTVNAQIFSTIKQFINKMFVELEDSFCFEYTWFVGTDICTCKSVC